MLTLTIYTSSDSDLHYRLVERKIRHIKKSWEKTERRIEVKVNKKIFYDLLKELLGFILIYKNYDNLQSELQHTYLFILLVGNI